MAEDLDLPNLGQCAVSSPVSPSRPRKRVRLSSPVFSSDPPLFSSDDDPSLDNYTHGRQKKQYRGPWFRQEPAPEYTSQKFHFYLSSDRDRTYKGKRVFERQYDSGVFLGSDCTDMDDSINGIQEASLSTPLPLSQPRSTQNSEPTAEELARKQIENCIEHGIENIDLSCQALTNLSNDTIRPLGALTPIHPRFDGTFFPIEPRLQIFLNSNGLSNLPEELFNLKDLTVLSLRGNKIHELPPAIGRLHNLVELNVSQNSLQFLPYEILDLFSKSSHLERFQIHPNPFNPPKFPSAQLQELPEEDIKCTVGSMTHSHPHCEALYEGFDNPERRSWHPKWNICYKARTEISYININGSHCKGPTISSDTLFGPRKFSDGIPIADVDDTPVPPASRPLSRAPSLLEVALKACSKIHELPSLQSLLPDDHPQYFQSMLAEVATKKESGNSKCTICNRNFIVARTEWIEWWEITKLGNDTPMASAASPLGKMENNRDLLERMVPLIRRGCSWLCVPERPKTRENAIAIES